MLSACRDLAKKLFRQGKQILKIGVSAAVQPPALQGRKDHEKVFNYSSDCLHGRRPCSMRKQLGGRNRRSYRSGYRRCRSNRICSICRRGRHNGT